MNLLSVPRNLLTYRLHGKNLVDSLLFIFYCSLYNKFIPHFYRQLNKIKKLFLLHKYRFEINHNIFNIVNSCSIQIHFKTISDSIAYKEKSRLCGYLPQ